MAESTVGPEKPGNAGGGKGPWLGEGEEIGASLTTPKSVWELQQALHAKAKREPACRFHSLKDKMDRKDVLLNAWRWCRANGGASGVDGVTFPDRATRSGRLAGGTWQGTAGEKLSDPSGRPGLDNQLFDFRVYT